MSNINLSAWPRQETGKGPTGRLRKAGYIPAILYGTDVEKNLNLKLKDADVQKVIHSGGGNAIISLNIDGEKTPATVMFKSLYRNPVKETIDHIDIVTVLMDQAVIVDVPVHLVGKAEGVALGGILQHELRKLKIECLPNLIPASIDVDVTPLDIGQSIHVSELTLPEGVVVKDDEGIAIVLVASPTVEEEKVEEVEEGAEGAEGEATAPAAEGEAPAEGEKKKEEKKQG